MWDRAVESWKHVVSLDTFVAVAWMLVLWFASQAVHQHERKPPESEVQTDAGQPYWVISPLLNNDYKSSSEQIVPASVLFVICSVVPMVVFLVLSLFDTCARATALRIQGIAYAFGGAAFCIDCVKRYCGYWRPYFYDQCGFDAATGKCTGDDDEAFKSFPSGHSGLSMVTMLYTSYCILGACRLGRPLRVKGVDLGGLVVIAGLLPVGLSLFVAASRVVDNDHWPADVVGGAVIGGGFATLYYHRYFPIVFEDSSHVPRAAFASVPSQGSGGEDLVAGAAAASA